jgi:superfamily II DNA or RNA helicase
LNEDDLGYYTYSGFKDLLINQGFKISNNIIYPKPSLIPWAKKPDYVLRYYQSEAIDLLLKVKHGAVEIACHRKNEKVLMYDGTIKNVQDIVIGNQLMGTDSNPRNVLELRTGFDIMYEIKTNNGQKMIVNGNHILVLRRTKRFGKKYDSQHKRRSKSLIDNPIIEMKVSDYLKQTKWFKHLHKLFSVKVDFKEREVPLDPYFMGLLLGDGSIINGVGITTADIEIVKYIDTIAKQFNLNVTIQRKPNNKAASFFLVKKGGRRNPISTILKNLHLFGHKSDTKFIPLEYKTNSRDIRLKILAGLLDTDGSQHNNGYDYISKSKQLSEDICYLVRSLGLRATVNECFKKCQTGNGGIYYRVSISGNTEIIPCILERKRCKKRTQIKNPNMFGFTVTKVSDNEQFFGFILDGDHRYLTDTFLVTHNTGSGKSIVLLELAKRLGVKFVLMTPTENICSQMYDLFCKYLGKKYVGQFGDGKKESHKQFVISIGASLTRLEPDNPHYKNISEASVFAVDEAHTVASETLEKVAMGICSKACYRFFVSGTQIRNDGGDLLLKGITGPVVYRLHSEPLINQGILAKPFFYFIPVHSYSDFKSKDPMKMIRAHYLHNSEVYKKVAKIVEMLHDKSILILIDEIKQYDYVLDALKLPKMTQDAFLAKGGTDTQTLIKNFTEGKFRLLIGTDAVSVGTNMYPEVLIMIQGGKSPIQFRQSVGRGLRVTKTKKEVMIFDFDIVNQELLHKHSEERLEIYRSIYDNIRILNDF